MNASRLFPLAALVSAGVLASAMPAAGADFKMKVAYVASATEEDHDGALVWKQYVESHSGGRVEVELYPNGQLGNFRQTVEQVQLGTVEVGFTTGGGISNLYPQIQAFDIPYIFPNDRVIERIMVDPILVGQLRADALKATGSMRLVGMASSGGWRSYFTKRGPVNVGADLKGMKIRTIESPLPMETVRSLGGNPTPVPWQELYTSFATGVVEGTMNSIVDIVANNFQDFIKFGVLDQHSFVMGFWWASDKWFKSLPADLQSVVLYGFSDMRTVANGLPKRWNIDAYEKFKKAGGTIVVPTAAQRATFMTAREPVQKWYVDKYGDTWVKNLQDAVTRAETAIAAEDKAAAM